jgi:hypothetical protein
MLALLVVFIQFYRHLYRQITTAIVGVGDGLNLSGNYASASIVNEQPKQSYILPCQSTARW